MYHVSIVTTWYKRNFAAASRRPPAAPHIHVMVEDIMENRGCKCDIYSTSGCIKIRAFDKKGDTSQIS